jgi:hypothetical protein
MKPAAGPREGSRIVWAERQRMQACEGGAGPGRVSMGNGTRLATSGTAAAWAFQGATKLGMRGGRGGDHRLMVLDFSAAKRACDWGLLRYARRRRHLSRSHPRNDTAYTALSTRQHHGAPPLPVQRVGDPDSRHRRWLAHPHQVLFEPASAHGQPDRLPRPDRIQDGEGPEGL